MNAAELTIDKTPSISNPAHVRDLEELISMAQHEILQADIKGEASINHYRKAGEYLEVLKSQCKHGTWYKTLDKVGISEDKADRYRKLYKSWHLLPINDLGVFSLRGALEYIKEKELPAQTSQTESPAIDVQHTEVVETEQRLLTGSTSTQQTREVNQISPAERCRRKVEKALLEFNAGRSPEITLLQLQHPTAFSSYLDPLVCADFWVYCTMNRKSKLSDSEIITGLGNRNLSNVYFDGGFVTKALRLSDANGESRFHQVVLPTSEQLEPPEQTIDIQSIPAELPSTNTQLSLPAAADVVEVDSEYEAPLHDERDEQIALLKQQLEKQSEELEELRARNDKLKEKVSYFNSFGYVPRLAEEVKTLRKENTELYSMMTPVTKRMEVCTAKMANIAEENDKLKVEIVELKNRIVEFEDGDRDEINRLREFLSREDGDSKELGYLLMGNDRLPILTRNGFSTCFLNRNKEFWNPAYMPYTPTDD